MPYLSTGKLHYAHFIFGIAATLVRIRIAAVRGIGLSPAIHRRMVLGFTPTKRASAA